VEVRRPYVDALLAAARSEGERPVHVLITLRADFYRPCFDHTVLIKRMGANLYNVPRASAERLREVIEKPLALAGAEAQPGLVDAILADVGDEPGNLPLLEHALSQLWDRRKGTEITHDAYKEIGRLGGALKNHADRVYDELKDPPLQDIARRIFLELTQLGERSEDTRRRVRKADLLAADSTEAEKVLKTLTEARLVVIGKEAEWRETGDEMAEVAHEALLRDWPRLRDWLEKSRDELRDGRRLAEKAEEWDSLSPKRHPDRLLRGQMLEEALLWAKSQKTPISVTVQEFLAAGRDEIIVVDHTTGLMWTRRDNGDDVNWHEANEYATHLRLGGYADWRLPTIEELEKLYDPKEGGKYNIRQPFRLTGYFVWSSTNEGPDSAWYFLFGDGRRSHNPLAASDVERALCVRGPGE
jgi:Protein of unknown function (DUF1566)